LTQLRRIAADVARQEAPMLEVVGVAPLGHESAYAELMLATRDGAADPRRTVVGVNRDTSESAYRTVLKERLQQPRFRFAEPGVE